MDAGIMLNAAKARTIALGLFMILVTVYYSARSYQTAARQEHDFSTYYLASTDARTGANPYRDRERQSPFIYPPTLLWLVSPLTHLDIGVANVVWTVLTVGAWVVAVRMGVAALPGNAAAGAALWLPSLITLRFLMRELCLGQVNLIVFALVVAAFWALQRKKDSLSGALIALAAHIKILPLAFVLPLVLWRRWRAVAGGVAAFAVLLILPGFIYGPQGYSRLVREFLDGRLLDHAASPAMDSHMGNQCLLATMNRYLTDVPALPSDIAPFDFHPVTLPIRIVATMAHLLGLTLLAACGFALYRCRGHPELYGLGFSLVFLTIHLVSKKTWEEHLVTLVFVYAAILTDPGGRPRTTAIAVGSAAVLQWIHTPILTGRPLSDHIQALGPVTMSLLILWGYLFARLMRLFPPRDTRHPPDLHPDSRFCLCRTGGPQ